MHIEDLTDEQVYKLTDDEVDLLIKRRMAEQGIPVLPVPVEPEYIDVPGPDVAVHEVAGVSFLDRDSAEAVQAVINQHAATRCAARYDYGTGYTHRYVESDDSEITVTTRSYYSTQVHAAQRDALMENERRKEAYRKEREAYDKAISDARSIRDSVQDRIAEVHEQRRRVDLLVDRFAEYRGIANGDELMAMQFLVKAFDLTDEEIAAVRYRVTDDE